MFCHEKSKFNEAQIVKILQEYDLVNLLKLFVVNMESLHLLFTPGRKIFRNEFVSTQRTKIVTRGKYA